MKCKECGERLKILSANYYLCPNNNCRVKNALMSECDKMRKKIWFVLKSTSSAVVLDDVIDVYEKGSWTCIRYIHKDLGEITDKYPTRDYFRIREQYKY